MNGLPYYKRYPRDFIEGTIGMPFEEKCAYGLVLDLIYMQGGHLPDDARYISGLLGCTIRKWKSLREALIARGKIQTNGGSISNYRAVSELETLSKLQDKQRENASGPRQTKDLQKPRLNQPEPEPEPEPEPDKKVGGGGSAGAREPDPHDEILIAAGIDPAKDVTGKWHGSEAIHTISRWRALKLSQAEIVETLRETAGRKRDGPIGSLRFFDDPLRRAAARKLEPPLTPATQPERYADGRPGQKPSRESRRLDAFLAGASRAG